LHLIAVARDFNRRRGAAVNRASVAGGRYDQLGSVSHADPVIVDDQKEIVDAVDDDIGSVGRSVFSSSSMNPASQASFVTCSASLSPEALILFVISLVPYSNDRTT